MMTSNAIPVITIDGPSGSGKGTIGQLVARRLGWHYLDSGALYRALAFYALREKVVLNNEAQLAQLALTMPLYFIDNGDHYRLFLDKEDITDLIRTEECSKTASVVAAMPQVRQNLLAYQRDCRKAPGLVTDGRDMGTIVFPDADYKFFLEASVEERAQRRYNQLLQLGICANIDAILAELEVRDARDRNRAVAPLKPAADAVIIDTTGLNINQTLERVKQALPENLG